MLGHAAADDRGEQRLGQLGARHDHRLGPRIVEDVEVIALGVGGVGWHGDQPGSHDRKVGDAPFGAVLRHQHHPVAGFEPQREQVFGEQADLVGGIAPAARLPLALGPRRQERARPALLGAREEHRDEAVVGFEVAELHACPLAPAHG